MTCDAHTHFFSNVFFRALAREAAGGESDSAARLLSEVLTKTGIELPAEDHREHARRWLAELDRGGIDRAVTFASVPSEAPAVFEGCAASGGRLIPYLVCDSSRKEGIEDAIEGLRRGARGILLFPAIHHVDPASNLLDPLYEEARGRRAPIVVHCGVLQIKLRDLLGVRPRYDLRYASPLAVAAAAERHRQNTFVLPHFGGGFYAEALIAGAQSPNVFVDTSSSNSWMATQPLRLELQDVFARTLSVFGPERILFGTDSSTFPRGWRQDIFEQQVAILDALGVDTGVRRRILGDNLLELLDT
jgi:predicted TIM-barrel fold metal-dependent hydrolase